MKKLFTLPLILLALTTMAQEYVIENLTSLTQFHEAIDIAHAPDGRILVAERAGAINVYENGVVTEILTVSTNTDTEQGLLGIAIHPDFTMEGWVYYFYTNAAKTLHHIERAWLDADNVVSNQQILLTLDPILGGFHNGGSMVFHQGYLYVSSGDSQQPAQSQDLTTYRGKILRLTYDGQPAPGNPYEDAETVQQRSIWAIGFRNPWRMHADPKTGRLFAVDVGTSWEEINDITAPDANKQYNYGWGHNQGGDGIKNSALLIDPIYAYATGSAEGCAITNGILYNPDATNYPDGITGKFIFSDWCRDELRLVNVDTLGRPSELMFAGLPGRPLGLSIGLDGNLYFADYNGDSPLSRLIYENNQVPQIVNHPQSQTQMETREVTFNVTASGAIPLTYQWQKDGVDLDGQTAASLTLNDLTFNDAGAYRVIVTNANGIDTSNTADLEIIPFNATPQVTITSPSPTLTFDGGQVITYSGFATDDEDGPLAVDALSWELQLWHQDTEESGHWHPGPGLPSAIDTGSFVADNQGEKSPNIWFMLIMKAVDSNGNEGRDTVEVFPNLVNITGQTEPSGLELLVSVLQQASPVTTKAVVNAKGLLNAPASQILDGTLYEFSHWLHGGGASQEFTVPDVDTTFTAVYTESVISQLPYGGTPAEIPGTVQAEEYDEDGTGVAYNDLSAGNAGGQFRADDVDIENASEGGYNVGWVNDGEWLEYTVNVLTTGFYDVTFRVTSPNTGNGFHLEVDETDKTGTLEVPNSGGFQNWQDVVFEDLPLTAGIHEIRFVAEGADFNFNYMAFELTATGPQADFIVSENEICVGDTVTVSHDSGGNPDTFEWDFGPGANPASADGAGPHQVIFEAPGSHEISLTVYQGELPSSMTKSGAVLATGLPQPQWSQAPDEVDCETPVIYFVDGQQGSDYVWTWGETASYSDSDGHGTNHEHVTLAFAQAGTSFVTLNEISEAGCVSDTLKVEVTVNCLTTDLPEHSLGLANGVYPNPTTGALSLPVSAATGWQLYNAVGQVVASGNQLAIDISGFDRGLYYLQTGASSYKVLLR